MEENQKRLVVVGVVVVVAGLFGVLLLINPGSKPAPAPAAVTPAPASAAVDEDAPKAAPVQVATPQEERIRFGPKLAFAVPAVGGLEVEGGRIVSGQIEAPKGDTGQIDMLADTEGQVWAQLAIEPSNKKSYLGRSVVMAQSVLAPMLTDDDGNRYEALGFAYEDASRRVVLVEPLVGMRGLSQAPTLNAARTDQKLWLLFRVQSGATIRSFWLGNKQMLRWEPGVKVE